MHFFFSAGEPSGDLHGSNLIRHLRQLHPRASFAGFGGGRMEAAGCRLLFDLTSLAVMFFDRIVQNYLTFRRLLRQADEYFAKHPVDAVILIDYPGFNWWVARIAKRHKIPVIYYGAPQLWAWAPWRIGKLKRLVDVVLCKLPFEPEWFRARGVNAHYIGHPFFDESAQAKLDRGFLQSWGAADSPTLLLLPGSRDREVQDHWPILRDAAIACQRQVPVLRVAVGCFRKRQGEKVQQDIDRRGLSMQAFVGRTPELMLAATACLACSGSVSLELMERRVPTVIVYRLNWMRRILRWMLLKCRYITLVNLMDADDIQQSGRWYDPDDPLCEDVPMPEYLLTRDRTESIATRLTTWLTVPAERQRRAKWLDRLAGQFAHPGASFRAAKIITNYISRRSAQAA